MDARRFPTEAGCRVGKSREDPLTEFALSGKRFSLARFFDSPLRGSPFGPASPFAHTSCAQWRFPKEMNLRAAGVRKLLLSIQIKGQRAKIKMDDQRSALL